MQANSRFEIIESIAQGDFATVYRARDLELGREVAVKQIHQQYLTDPKKLDRYWHEAQLLARLEHPYIMTIYDIVRGRGWLILELMQGSLKEKLAGKPIDLEDLRLTLTYMLHALSFLEKNGIVHGDVKPSNLLLDKNHRVKLGDFGIARRMTCDDGSVVKGTTKYMAPEVVSDQFGPVGPHSDLYALGFSAFELMCGEYFDSLFPGLNMFGRDQQIAWMMWHSAPDRRLPEISRVLQGVPADLAHVIAKLTEKDPARRYRTAEEALKDLRSKTPVATGADGEESDKTKPDGQPDRRRYLVFGALALSLLLSLAMVFLPSSGNSDKPGIGPGDRPESGLVVDVNLEQNVIGIKVPNGKDGGILFNPDIDTIQLHIGQRRELIDLNALRPGDQLRMQYTKTDRGVMQTIIVTRAETESLSGTIDSIDRPKMGRNLFLTASYVGSRPKSSTSSERLRIPMRPHCRR